MQADLILSFQQKCLSDSFNSVSTVPAAGEAEARAWPEREVYLARTDPMTLLNFEGLEVESSGCPRGEET